jgi:hypothetical protein
MSSALAIAMILFSATECTTAKAEIEDSAIFFLKEGSTLHTLRYSNIMIEYDLDEVEKNIHKIRDALQKYHKDVGSGRMPLHMYHTGRSTGFIDDPTMHAAEIDQHRYDYIFTAHLNRLIKFRGLFRKMNDEIEHHALAHPTESRDFYFGGQQPAGMSSRAQRVLFDRDAHDTSIIDGNDDPAPDPLEWYHRKQGKHNAFSGIMMIRKKGSTVTSFQKMLNAN